MWLPLFVDCWQETFICGEYIICKWLQLLYLLSSIPKARCCLLGADWFSRSLGYTYVLRVLNRYNCLISETDFWKFFWDSFFHLRIVLIDGDSLWIFGLNILSVFWLEIKLKSPIELNSLIHIVNIEETVFSTMLLYTLFDHASSLGGLDLRHVNIKFLLLEILFWGWIAVDQDLLTTQLVHVSLVSLSLLTFFRIV